jgi:ornithine cyclodeaminase
LKYPILDDSQIDELVSMKEAIERIEKGFHEHANGTLLAPPRFTVQAENGSMVFTAGGSSETNQAIGFRVYETFPKDTPLHTQLVAAFDSMTGEFKGVALGFRLGIIRTGAIGGVAIKYLSIPDASSIGIIGSGTQARAQLEAAAIVRNLSHAKVYSPTESHRVTFASEMSEKLDLTVEAVTTSAEAVNDSDILICSTRSKSPVFEARHLKSGMHVTTMGPNLEGRNEIEYEVADKSAIITTDSLAQVDRYGTYTEPYFLAPTKHREHMVELREIVSGDKPGRSSENDISLFCSVGLAGTEVLLANIAFEKAKKS